MDTQTIEILGRNRLVGELLRAGLEVALPMRDRGIDLIAYAELSDRVKSFIAVPIQMKAATGRSFSVSQKYGKISNLLLAHVWHIGSHEAVTFALTQPQALAVADEMGWTKTASWDRGIYSTNNPGKKLCSLLEQYRMTDEKWWALIVGAAGV